MSVLEFERSLDVHLAERVEVPPSVLAGVRERVEAGCRPLASPSWTERIFGRTLMRKMLVSGTALAALFVVAFALFPTGARAATARETFRQMKAALAASKKQMAVTVVATVTADNQVNATVSTPAGGQDTPLTVGVKVQRDGNTVNATATVSFDEADFSKISFGKDKYTLVLVPKRQADRKYAVALDRKSKLPLTWTVYAKNGKTWKETGQDRFVYKEKQQPAAKSG